MMVKMTTCNMKERDMDNDYKFFNTRKQAEIFGKSINRKYGYNPKVFHFKNTHRDTFMIVQPKGLVRIDKTGEIEIGKGLTNARKRG